MTDLIKKILGELIPYNAILLDKEKINEYLRTLQLIKTIFILKILFFILKNYMKKN